MKLKKKAPGPRRRPETTVVRVTVKDEKRSRDLTNLPKGVPFPLVLSAVLDLAEGATA